MAYVSKDESSVGINYFEYNVEKKVDGKTKLQRFGIVLLDIALALVLFATIDGMLLLISFCGFALVFAILTFFLYKRTQIEYEYESSDIFREEMLKCLTHELFYLFARNFDERARVATGNIFVEQTVKYIQQNYMSEISLPSMAKMRSVSPEHLSRTFRKETGFGFSEYLTLVRLQKAEYMLKNEPGKSVSDVAYACGFNDSNYFSDKFRKAYGISPSKAKKHNSF